MNFLPSDKSFYAFAHRGGTEFAPENTFEAFSNAVEIGYEFLETDVHINADGELMAFHDSTIDRVTNYEGELKNFTSNQLKKIKINDKFNIPLLADLIEAFASIFFSVDMKTDDTVIPLIKLVNRMGVKDRICFASFNQKRLKYVRDEYLNKCITSLGPNEIAQTKLFSILGKKIHIKSRIASLPISKYKIQLLNKSHIEFLKSSNIKVIAWTINKTEEMKHLINMGVDGIMTDNISSLKKILIKKNLW